VLRLLWCLGSCCALMRVLSVSTNEHGVLSCLDGPYFKLRNVEGNAEENDEDVEDVEGNGEDVEDVVEGEENGGRC
ncbi:hypothetical protein THOM_0223, partial [Trachipleistophora hominis]